MTAESGGGSITSFLTESRVFPPPAEFAAPGAHRQPRASTRRSGTGPRTTPRASGARWPGRSTWSKPWDKVLDWKPPYAQVVRRRQAQRLVQLRRPPLRGAEQEQGRDHLGGRAGRPPGPPLSGPPARGRQVRQRAQGAGRQEGRRGRDLHADDPRAGRSPCSPAPGSGRRTRSSSAASAPRPWPAGSRTARRRSWSPPTAAIRRGKVVPLKENADGAVAICPTIKNVVVYRRTGHDVAMTEGRDHWWHDLVDGRLAPTARPSRSTASTRSTSSTPRARPASRRGSSTRPAATSSARR